METKTYINYSIGGETYNWLIFPETLSLAEGLTKVYEANHSRTTKLLENVGRQCIEMCKT